MPGFRPQYSLATLLLLVTVTCLAVALWSTSRELRELRTENQKYRNESGYLTITDPKNVHAIRIPQPGDSNWHWRVFIPEGRQFRLRTLWHNIPEKGFSSGGGQPSSFWTLVPGEQIIFAGVSQNLAGERVFRVRSNRASTYFPVGDWLMGSRWEFSSIGTSTRSVSPGEPLELLRLRATEQVQEKQPDGTIVAVKRSRKDPGPGFLVWIEDESAEKQRMKNKPVAAPSDTPQE